MSKSTTWYLIQQIFLNINTINLSTLRTLFSIQRFSFNVNAFSFSTSTLQSVLNEERQIASTKTMLLHYQLFLIFKLSHEPKAFKINKQNSCQQIGSELAPCYREGLGRSKTKYPGLQAAWNVHCRCHSDMCIPAHISLVICVSLQYGCQ